MAGTISTLGIGSGIDLQGMLEQLREIDQQVVDAKNNKIKGFQDQLAEFTTVNNKLLTLKSAALDLSLSSNFLGRAVTSSDETVAKTTVADGAVEQSALLEVTRLAAKSSWLSTGGVASADSSVTATDTTLSFQVGTGDPVSIAVAADTTLTELAALINDAEDNPGVTATVINDGDAATPYRLSLQSNTIGEDGRITIPIQLADMTMADQHVASLNAQFSVDGINYQRQSNSFSDVISGVTITLENEGKSTIIVSKNNTSIKDMIKGLVTAYNDAVQEVRTNSSYNTETGKFGALFGTTLRDLPNTLRNLMTSTISADETGKVTTLFDLGLEFNRDGTISLNEETVDAALADYPDAISAFFLGDSDRDIQGFADMINERMRTLTGAAGQIAGEKQSAQDRITETELKVAAENERLDKKYELMAKQFTELDRYMRQMTSLSDYLSNQFDSISNAWGAVGGSNN